MNTKDKATVETPVAAVSDKDLQARLHAKRLEMRDRIAEKIRKGESVDASVRALRDPFSSRNPHQIIAHPPGRVLSWKNPKYRQERGWRGWTPVSHDDEVGRRLKEYITDPPAKMEGSADLDNYVRRGTDSVLCWLPEDVWLARQLENTQRALEAETRAAMRAQVVVRNGVVITGDGGVRKDTGRDLTPRQIEGELLGSREMLGDS